MIDQQPLTRAGYQALSDELRELEARREDIIERLETIDEDEDGTEGPYFQATREREDIETRIAYVREQLANADIVEGEDIETVSVGNRVTVYHSEDEAQHVFDVVATAETPSDETAVTVDSPVGSALVGQQVGDRVTVETPEGNTDYRIANIQPMPATE